MNRTTRTRVDRWEEMFDRDIENLIDGRTPVNTDLQPLRGFIEALRAMALEEVSDVFIEMHASESAAAAAAARSAQPSVRGAAGGKARLAGLRPRLATVGTSLALVLGMTGVSWAADGAVPGDWYYGIDRALEAVGIGAGGAVERLEELQAANLDANESGMFAVESEANPKFQGIPGLERAATAVASASEGGGVSAAVRARVVEKLLQMNEGAPWNGSTVSGIAKDRSGPPDHVGAPDHAGRPEDPGKPDQSGVGGGADRDGSGSGKGNGSERP